MSFVRILLRLIVVTIGFLGASIVAGAIMLIYGLNGGRFPEMSPEAFTLWGLALGGIAGYTAIVASPALLGALAAEFFRLRQWWFHIGLGVVMAVIAYAWVLRDFFFPDPAPMSVTLAAGLAGGTVYWLIAGASAGLRKVQA